MKNIRNLLIDEFQNDEIDLDVYFMHVNSDSFQGKPKGLDDLILSAEKEKEELDVIWEMNTLKSRNNKILL